MKQFSLADLFPELQPFKSGNVDNEELERIVRETVEREHPDSKIKSLEYTKDGIEITLDTGEEIEIEVDWQEIILT